MSTNSIEEAVVVHEPATPAKLFTLGELGIRSFHNADGTDNGWVSTKDKCPISVEIPMDQYLLSKTPNDNATSRTMKNITSFEVMDSIQGITHGIAGAGWSKVFVYRDHVRYDGYVDKMTKHMSRSKLLNPSVPITDLVFQRVIAVMDLLPTRDGISYKMAVKYEPGGLEVAIGTHVDICANWNIFAGKHYKVGNNISFEGMIAIIEKQVRDIENSWGADMDLIRMMMTTDINQNYVYNLIGEMAMMYHKGMPIMNITELNEFGRNIHAAPKMETLWDLVNAGTQGLKFNQSAGSEIIDYIGKFTEYNVNRMLGLS